MGVGNKQKRVRAYRGQMASPGRPTVAWREDRVRFWTAIAAGAKTREAGVAAGVSEPVAYRWFRHAGGVNPHLAPTLSGRYLSSSDRENIALWRAQGSGVREIARRLGRSPSTISRELRRNASTRTYRLDYRASTAQWHAERRARRPKEAKLMTNERLRDFVNDKLSGHIRTYKGKRIGPSGPSWDGKNKPHREDREWVTGWSPQQIARRLLVEFPDDPSMRISHEAIYQALYVPARGALRREQSWHLRRGRTKRMPRARTRTGPLMVTLVLSFIHPDESPGPDPAAANLGLLVAIGFAVLALPCHLILRKADILQRQSRPDIPPAQPSLRKLLRTPGVVKSTLVSAMVLVSVDLLYTFLPIWASEKNIAISTVTWLLALRAGISLISRLGLGALIVRTGRRPLLQATVILAAASMFCFPFVGLPGAIVITILLGIGLGIPQPLTMAWTSSLVQPTAQGAALGLRLTANRFAQTTVPLLLGVASVPLGMPGIFCLGSLLLVGSACAIDRTTGTGDGRNY